MTANHSDRNADDIAVTDDVAVRYESVHGDSTAATHVVEGTVTHTGRSRIEFEDGDDHYDLVLDGGTAVELKKRDSHGTPRRIGYPADVQVAEPIESGDDLDAGDVLSVTYDGPHGRRTATVEVVDVTDGVLDQTDVRALEPDERRYVTFSFGADGPTSSVSSLRSKSEFGRRLGWFERAVLVGHRPDSHRDAIDAAAEASAGDRVALHGPDETLTGALPHGRRSSGSWTVELDDGRRGSVHATAAGVTLSGIDVHRREVDVEVLGTDDRNETDEQAAAQAWVGGLSEGDEVSLGGTAFVVCRDTGHTVGVTERVEVVPADDYDPDEQVQTGVTLMADALGLYVSARPGEGHRLPTAEVLAENGAGGGADDDGVARAVARVEDDGRDGYERDRVPPVPTEDLADDPVADALDAYRPDDPGDDLVTDGGTDVDVAGLVHLPSTTAVAMWVHPLPAFEDYDEATVAARDMAVDYVERVLDRERGVDRGEGVETDGGEPIRPDGDGDDGLRVTCSECWFGYRVDPGGESDMPESCPECGGDVDLVTFDGGRDLSRYEGTVVEFRTTIGFMAHARVVLAPDPDGPDDRPLLARLIGPVRPAEQPDDPTPYGQSSFAPHAEQFAGEAVNAGDELVNLSAPGRESVQVVAESDIWAAGRYALESVDGEGWAEAGFGHLAYVHVCETCGETYRDETEPAIHRTVSRCPACEVDRGEGVETDGGRDVPGCVLCGVTSESGASLLSVDVGAVPVEARDANAGVDRLDRAPVGTVWVCRGCYDDALLGRYQGHVDTDSLRVRTDEALQARLDALRDVQALAHRRGNDDLYRRASRRKEAIRRELCDRQVARARRDTADGRDTVEPGKSG